MISPRPGAEVEAQLAALKTVCKESGDTTDSSTRRQPKRQALPEHLKRVEHHHEPENTTCGCGQAMVRIGEDVSERLLRTAVRRTLDGINAIVELEAEGRPPVRRPGVTCRWCPLADTCDAGQAHLAGQRDDD